MRYFAIKCQDDREANVVVVMLRHCEQVEVVEIIPEKRDLTWWQRATVNRMVNVMDGSGPSTAGAIRAKPTEGGGKA